MDVHVAECTGLLILRSCIYLYPCLSTVPDSLSASPHHSHDFISLSDTVGERSYVDQLCRIVLFNYMEGEGGRGEGGNGRVGESYKINNRKTL